jgi:hypothetical protein
MLVLTTYVYVLDGITTANGEVGISGSRCSPYEVRPSVANHGGPTNSSRLIFVLL